MQRLPFVDAVARSADQDPRLLRELLRGVPENEAETIAALDRLGVLPLDQGYRIWAECLGVGFAALDDRSLDQRLLQRLPLDVARRHAAVPVEERDGVLSVALKNPFDILAVDAIQESTGQQVQVLLSTPQAIDRVLQRMERSRTGIEGLIARIEKAEVDLATVGDAEKLRKVVGDDAVIQLVDFLVEEALREGASDVHVEPLADKLRVRIRVDGDLETTHTFPPGLHRAVVARIKVVAGMDIGESRRPQDGRIAVDENVELRCSVLPSVLGEKAVLRVLNRSSIDLDPKRLGMSLRHMERFRRGYTAPNGIVLVTGPTGSGKTTTLYTAMAELNRPETNLVSVEDPVEYRMAGATQVQVDLKADRTFASALRAILRQDPDVVMVGEIRDAETAAVAIQAALTGHVVLSTLHTNSALGAVHRLIDMEVAPYLLGPALRCVVGQRLVPRVCAHCAEPVLAAATLLAEFGLQRDPGGLRNGRGCRECRGRGTRGRVAIHEVLAVTPELSRAISRSVREDELERLAFENGYERMLQDGLEKARQGLVTLEDVLAAARAD